MKKRITFISDTHNKHKQITSDLLGGDILIHSGDISSMGHNHEIKDFCEWFNNIEGYTHKIFIAGNHDWGFQDNVEETMQIVMQNGFIPYLATEEGRLKSSIRMNSDQHPMKNPIIAAKKVQTDIDRGNESWMTTDRGKEYFREKFKSDQHPLRLKPWNARTAFEVEVELVNGDILHYKMLKEFYDSYGINKDVAAKIIKTGIIPTKHQKKFKRICKRDSSTSAT